eukprot:89653_1
MLVNLMVYRHEKLLLLAVKYPTNSKNNQRVDVITQNKQKHFKHTKNITISEKNLIKLLELKKQNRSKADDELIPFEFISISPTAIQNDSVPQGTRSRSQQLHIKNINLKKTLNATHKKIAALQTKNNLKCDENMQLQRLIKRLQIKIVQKESEVKRLNKINKKNQETPTELIEIHQSEMYNLKQKHPQDAFKQQNQSGIEYMLSKITEEYHQHSVQYKKIMELILKQSEQKGHAKKPIHSVHCSIFDTSKYKQGSNYDNNIYLNECELENIINNTKILSGKIEGKKRETKIIYNYLSICG